jgi:hypothetical protein
MISAIVAQLPVLLVALAGAVVSIVMMPRARTAGVLALLGCVMLLGRVLLLVLAGVEPRLHLRFVYVVMTVIAAELLFVVGIALVIGAAAVGRARRGSAS